jgi:hypothetical protein
MHHKAVRNAGHAMIVVTAMVAKAMDGASAMKVPTAAMALKVRKKPQRTSTPAVTVAKAKAKPAKAVAVAAMAAAMTVDRALTPMA